MKRRAVITGMGIVSSAGCSSESFGDSIANQKNSLHQITDSRIAHLKTKYAGSIDPATFESLRIADSPDWYDRLFHLSLPAATQALAQSGINPALLSDRMGILFGTCSGSMLSIERHYERIIRGDEALTKNELFAKKYYSCAIVLAQLLKISGYTNTIVTACSASTSAIGFATDLIRCGELDCALAGGGDSLAASTLAGFDGLKATTSGLCAPFSKPVGLNLGEAATLFVIEEREHALARGATVLAEILGFGLSNDAYHATSPDPSGRGASAAMQEALRDAGVAPSQIGYISAHGTGTEANDKTETRAIKKVFGALSDTIPVSSTKSMVGHCLGAAGALETMATIVCALRGVVPSTANFVQPREGCTLDYVSQPNRPWTTSPVFLKNSFAFGGNNASLVLATSLPPIVADFSLVNDPICITGCGVVSSAGIGLSALVEKLLASKTAPVPTTLPLANGLCIEIAPVPDFDSRKLDRRLDLRGMDRCSHFAAAATSLALSQAGLGDRASSAGKLGFFVHLSSSPSQGESEHLIELLKTNFHSASIAAFPYLVPNSVTGNVCRVLGLTGFNTTSCSGPGAGLAGIPLALSALRCGHVSAILTGSADEISQRLCADSITTGTSGSWLPSEGAAMLVLETLSHATLRSASPLALVRGYATTIERHNPDSCANSSDALKELLKRLFLKVECDADDISVVCGNTDDPVVALACESIVPQAIKIDTRAMLGSAEATDPLFSICAALAKPMIGNIKTKNYFLCAYRSPTGILTTIILEPVDRKRPS